MLEGTKQHIALPSSENDFQKVKSIRIYHTGSVARIGGLELVAGDPTNRTHSQVARCVQGVGRIEIDSKVGDRNDSKDAK